MLSEFIKYMQAINTSLTRKKKEDEVIFDKLCAYLSQRSPGDFDLQEVVLALLGFEQQLYLSYAKCNEQAQAEFYQYLFNVIFEAGLIKDKVFVGSLAKYRKFFRQYVQQQPFRGNESEQKSLVSRKDKTEEELLLEKVINSHLVKMQEKVVSPFNYLLANPQWRIQSKNKSNTSCNSAAWGFKRSFPASADISRENYKEITEPELLRKMFPFLNENQFAIFIQKLFCEEKISFSMLQAVRKKYRINFSKSNFFSRQIQPDFFDLHTVLMKAAWVMRIEISNEFYFKHTLLRLFANVENIYQFKQMSPASFDYLKKAIPTFFLKTEIIFKEIFPHLHAPVDRELMKNKYLNSSGEVRCGDLHGFSFEEHTQPGVCSWKHQMPSAKQRDAYRCLSIYTNNNRLKLPDLKWQAIEKASSTFMNYEDFFYITQFGEHGFYQTKINLDITRNYDFCTEATGSNRLAISIACFLYEAFLSIRENKSRPLRVLELGAGDGSLCVKIFEYINQQAQNNPLWQELYERIDYATMDISQRLLNIQREHIDAKCCKRGVKYFSGDALHLEESEYYLSGMRADLIFSNELMDMFPPRKFKWGSNGQWQEEFIVPTVSLKDLAQHFPMLDLKAWRKEAQKNLSLFCRVKGIEQTLNHSQRLFLSKKQFVQLQSYYVHTERPIINFYQAETFELPLEHDPKLYQVLAPHFTTLEREFNGESKIFSPRMRDFIIGLNHIANHEPEHPQFPIFLNVDYGSSSWRKHTKIMPKREEKLKTYSYLLGRQNNYLCAPGWQDITHVPSYSFLAQEAKQLNYEFFMVTQGTLAKKETERNPDLKRELAEEDQSSVYLATVITKDLALKQVFMEENILATNADMAKYEFAHYSPRCINK